MTKLTVKSLSKHEWGGSIVRLHHSHREGIERYGIARVTNTDDPSKHCDAVLLGHDDKVSIFMAYDTRTSLGVDKGQELNFTLDKIKWWGKIFWYLKTPDPRIYVPAWLALWSVILGGLGILLGICSLFN